MSAPPTSSEDLHVCSICDELISEEEPVIISYGEEICLECLTTLISRVVDDKDVYPVKLGSYKTPFNYSNHLDATLLEQYRLKEVEHSTFPHERVFCSCGKFIGCLIIHREGEEYIAVKSCLDSSCQRFSCLNCATKLEDIADIIDHGCKETRQAKEADKQKMLQSDERGTKFQLCPNCSRPIQLTEACHHIKCPCGTEFCYLCGKAASERSGHWRQGRCPRFPVRPAPLPPARPATEQDRRDIANGIGPRLAGLDQRLAHVAQTGHRQGFNDDEVIELVRALQNDVADGLEVPLPPRRPEPRPASPPLRPDIPRGVSPGSDRQRLHFNPLFAPDGHPVQPVRHLSGEELLSNAPDTMGDNIDIFPNADRQQHHLHQVFQRGQRFEEQRIGVFNGEHIPVAVPENDPDRWTFQAGQRHVRRLHGLRTRLPSPEPVPAQEETEPDTMSRDNTDALSTPSPPLVPRIPPGRAVHFPHLEHFPPREDNFFPHSAVFHPPPPVPPRAFAHPAHLSPFLHFPPSPAITPAHLSPFLRFPLPPATTSAHHRPHMGFMSPPPRPTTRPQAPDDRQAGGSFVHFPPPPSGPWNDNDNA